MKNIPQSQDNTSVKKIRVIRRVEVKILQEMDEKVEKGPKKCRRDHFWGL